MPLHGFSSNNNPPGSYIFKESSSSNINNEEELIANSSEDETVKINSPMKSAKTDNKNNLFSEVINTLKENPVKVTDFLFSLLYKEDIKNDGGKPNRNFDSGENSKQGFNTRIRHHHPSNEIESSSFQKEGRNNSKKSSRRLGNGWEQLRGSSESSNGSQLEIPNQEKVGKHSKSNECEFQEARKKKSLGRKAETEQENFFGEERNGIENSCRHPNRLPSSVHSGRDFTKKGSSYGSQGLPKPISTT